MTEAFSRIIGSGFRTLQDLYIQIGQRITAADSAFSYNAFTDIALNRGLL